MKKKRNKNNIWPALKRGLPFFGILIGIGLLVVINQLIANYFKVKQILCFVQNQQACSPQLISALEQSLLGQPMFFKDYLPVLVSSGKLTEPVSLVYVTKRLPDTLELGFQQELPLYIINYNNQQAVVSTSGRLFQHAVATASNYFIINSQSDLSLNGMIQPDIHHTLSSLVTTLQELDLAVKDITWVDKSTIRLSMDERAVEAVIDSEHPKQELHKLAVIMKSREYQEFTEPVKEIDLRFTMPVLRTQQ